MTVNRLPAPPDTSLRERTLDWAFPLPRPQTGVMVGNGTLGLMVWGDAALHITVSRNGFWDHRGGGLFAPAGTYAQLRPLVERKDVEGIHDLLGTRSNSGPRSKPEQFGGGRLVVEFGNGLRPILARLILADGSLEIQLAEGDTVRGSVTLRLARETEFAWLEDPGGFLVNAIIRCLPAWHFIGDAMSAKGIGAPTEWEDAQPGGFEQPMPEDDALAITWSRKVGGLSLATALAPTGEAQAAAYAKLNAADTAALGRSIAAWWNAYWSDVPDLRVPDPTLQFLYDYGVFRQAGLTPPEGLPATLQGAWMEETRIPPWSNDFHFNINLQMIYGPALPTNRPAHYRPLWEMMRSWLPLMRAAGESFFGRPGALMLPHAVDDRCKNIGGFWAGTIDHACTAWMASIAWDYFRHTGDRDHLRELAWPLLRGAFEGYAAMLEKIDDGNGGHRWSLPVSVSPEFGGSNIDRCWGRDASFQFAALHRVLSILPVAAAALGEGTDPHWREIADGLPHYTAAVSPETEAAPARTVIGLWEGLALPSSHRHHSHLAGIHPFGTLDPADPAHAAIIADSMRQWIGRGAGHWTGWSVVWAAQICTRMDWVDGAALWLAIYRSTFMNPGAGPLHDANHAGFSTFGSHAWPTPEILPPEQYAAWEVIQLDGALGSVTVILEMLVHERGPVAAPYIYITPRTPRLWPSAEIRGVALPGGFLVDADWRDGHPYRVRIVSRNGGVLRIRPNLGERWSLNGRPISCAEYEADTYPGEVVEMKRET